MKELIFVVASIAVIGIIGIIASECLLLSKQPKRIAEDVAAEREACARIAEGWRLNVEDDEATRGIAAAIRARGNTTVPCNTCTQEGRCSRGHRITVRNKQ